MIMKTRLIKNYVTTLIGVGALVFAAYMQYNGGHAWSELTAWYTLGLTFLRSKDSLIGLPKE